MTPFGVYALYFKTCSTAQTVVEEGSAQRSRVDAVAVAVQISVPTRPSCKTEYVDIISEL